MHSVYLSWDNVPHSASLYNTTVSLPKPIPTKLAAIISAIGHIENFASAAALKSYFGWAPKREQTGIWGRAKVAPAIQTQVQDLINQGMSVRTVAKTLHVAKGTVQKYKAVI